jgi:hypothetical protein
VRREKAKPLPHLRSYRLRFYKKQKHKLTARHHAFSPALIGASSRHFRAIRETPLLWQLVQRIGVKYVPRVKHGGERSFFLFAGTNSYSSLSNGKRPYWIHICIWTCRPRHPNGVIQCGALQALCSGVCKHFVGLYPHLCFCVMAERDREHCLLYKESVN